MAAPASVAEFLDLVHKSGVTDDKRLDAYLSRLRSGNGMPAEPSKLAGLMVRDGILTHFQAEHLMQGKWRRFTIGKYKVLERLGSGGMGTVFLCEHKLMRCLRAIKILPAAKAQDEAALSRFYREARAVAAIDHPNIVHAYDIDQDEALHFLVMEYVDGASLQDLVKKAGPMDVLRACHYIRQAAIGLDHAHRAGLVHRDIKPGNILVSRDGAVKILDLGLARFFNDDEDVLTRKFDENVLGTADYLAPEQAIDSHTVDIRADIYSLGATFYYLLTGKTPFGEGTVAQKLLWHQSRQPKAVREVRPDVPVEIEAIISRMMAKEPGQRYAVPGEVAEALAAWVQAPIGPPPEEEMPRLSPAASGRLAETADGSGATAISRPETPRALKGMGSGSSSARSGQIHPATNPSSASHAAPAPSKPASPAPAPAPRPSTAVKASPPPAPAPAPVLQSAVAAGHPAPAPAAPQAEEDFAWQALAGDTDRLAADADTTPERDAARPQPAAGGERKAQARDRGVILLVVGLMVLAGGLVVVIGGGIWLYFFLTAAPAAVQERPRLAVAARDAGKPGVYKSLQAALRVAQQGDVIEIADETLEENVVVQFNNRNTTEVTVQAAPGKQVVWRAARKDPATPILRLDGAAFFKLKGEGITLDGDLGDKGKVKDLVLILSSAHGLTVEGAQFKNFGRSAVAVNSAQGNLEHPIRLQGLTGLTPPADKDGCLIHLDARPDMRFNQIDYIEISDVRGAGLAENQLVRSENGTLGDKLVRFPGRK